MPEKAALHVRGPVLARPFERKAEEEWTQRRVGPGIS
jgi:hypothetical protein